MTTKTVQHELSVVQLSGEPAGTMEVERGILEGRVNMALLHQVATAYRASRRAGSADTKVRSEVSGGGKKPWKQKHTGRARAGSIRSPLWRHGGITFGPHPRDFRVRLPLRMRRAALCEAVRAKVRDQELTVIEALNAQGASTKAFAGMKLLHDGPGAVLVVLDRWDPAVVRSLRNVPAVRLVPASQVTAFDILNHRRVLVTRAAWPQVAARWRGGVPAPAESRRQAGDHA